MKDKYGIEENQFQSCVRTEAFRKRFGLKGMGCTHQYGQAELDAILRVVNAKREWAKAMMFEAAK